MNRNRHGNALLVELLIVVLFFMLASTVLLQIFAAARSQGAKAEALTEATAWAQNIADTLYASPKAESALEELGFSPSGEGWRSAEGELSASVVLDREAAEAGYLNRYVVNIFSGEDILITLPAIRYEEGKHE